MNRNQDSNNPNNRGGSSSPRRPVGKDARRAAYLRARHRQRRLQLLLAVFVVVALGTLALLGVMVVRRKTPPAPPSTSDSGAVSSTSSAVSENPGTTPTLPAVTTDPPATTTPAVTDPPVSDARTLSLIACGDNIVHSDIIRDAQRRANTANPNYNFYDMYAGVARLIGGADISFINMEGNVAGPSFGYNGYPNFNAPNEIAEAFVKLGFDVVNVANNHMLDNGEAGLKGTVEYFRTLNFMTIGGYKKTDFDDLRIFEKNGIRVAFLSYCEMINFGKDVPASSDYLIPFIKEEDMTRQIKKAKSAADFVVVSLHFGEEDSFEPSAAQKRAAQLCADLGADVVIGHHSHTVQPAGWLTGKNGNRTFVTYSLGNFISTQYYAKNMAGAMLSLTFRIDADGTKSVENPKLIPTVTHYVQDPASEHREGLQLYRVSEYTEALAAAHGTNVHNAFSLSILRAFYTSVIPEVFLEW